MSIFSEVISKYWARSVKRYCWIVILIPLYFILSSYTQSLFYVPDRIVYDRPERLGYLYEEVYFLSKDQTKLHGWFLPAQTNKNGIHEKIVSKGTVVYYHGNAQNVTAQWHFANWFTLRGFNVFVFDYRGFGLSEGTPTPKGVFEDSNSALEYIRTRLDINPHKLFIFGQSLGGNNALAVVGSGNNKGVLAVAIESTFFSYSAIANSYIYGTGIFTNNRYSADRYIANISPLPLLLLHGTADQVIPYQQGEKLFAIARAPKKFVAIEQGKHIGALYGADAKKYQDLLIEFFEATL